MKSLIVSCAILITLSLGALSAVHADSATWSLNPTSGDWNTATNWTPPTVPNARADIASFGVSNTAAVSLSASAEVNEIVFNPGATAYTVTATTRSALILSGVGISNNSGVTQNFATTSFEGDQSLGVITFTGTASAGEDTVFTNNDGTSVVFGVGTTVFRDNSSAGRATIINRGGTAPGRFGGETDLFDSATGADSTIIVNGAEVARADGAILFISGNAGNATIILNDGVGGSGGVLVFDVGGRGGTARIEVFGNGIVDKSPLFDALTVGSIEGDGTILVGDFTLTVGTNNLSTVFSGLIKDGPNEGIGGSLRKIGAGVLTLSGANKYTGQTSVDEGGLAVENSEGSATGATNVYVKGGTLSGTGTIYGPVTIGTGSGSGAILDPGNDTTPGTLTVQNHLILHADATCTVLIDSDTPAFDQVTAKGIRIRNASVLFQDVGTALLPSGTTFTVMNNIAATRIKGTFSNLADGAIITIGGNTFQASYEGGDGNDLTLTVVP